MKGLVLSGEYEHVLDDKGRVTLPAKFREYFERAAFITRSVDEHAPCVDVFPPEAWAEYEAKKVEPREESGTPDDDRIIRTIYRNLTKTEPDKQGRVLIPSKLVERFRLNEKVVILGRHDRLEIWNPQTLEAYDAEEDQAGAA
jgi:MraZ protein